MRLRPIALGALIALVLLASAVPAASALSRWTGGIDLYRTGVFTTQKTWLWCTAADVQIIRNIVDRQTDHSRSHQQVYFDFMRAHNRYTIPLKDGVDPAGWTAGLRHYVDRRYRLVASTSFASALKSAVTNLRKTSLPVGITVAHGNHAWVLTGFTATADPARTTAFTVTSVRVTGPLWGLQSRSYGYDMRPDTRLTPTQFRSFFTPWHYAGVRMAWEGRWVSVQAIPTSTASTSASGGSAATGSSDGGAGPAGGVAEPAERRPHSSAAATGGEPGIARAPGDAERADGAAAEIAPIGFEGPAVSILVMIAVSGGMLGVVTMIRRRRVLA